MYPTKPRLRLPSCQAVPGHASHTRLVPRGDAPLRSRFLCSPGRIMNRAARRGNDAWRCSMEPRESKRGAREDKSRLLLELCPGHSGLQ